MNLPSSDPRAPPPPRLMRLGDAALHPRPSPQRAAGARRRWKKTSRFADLSLDLIGQARAAFYARACELEAARATRMRWPSAAPSRTTEIRSSSSSRTAISPTR